MKFRSQGSGIGGFSSGNMKLVSGTIFGERPLVDARERDLHVGVFCVWRFRLHQYCYGGVVAAMATQTIVFLFHTTRTHLYYYMERFAKTSERCYRHLRRTLAYYSYWYASTRGPVEFGYLSRIQFLEPKLMVGAARCALIEDQTPTARVPSLYQSKKVKFWHVFRIRSPPAKATGLPQNRWVLRPKAAEGRQGSSSKASLPQQFST
jgi:hypothetical protein